MSRRQPPLQHVQVEEPNYFRISKNVPLAVILAIVFQTGVLLWSYAGLSWQVQDLEKWRVSVDTWRDATLAQENKTSTNYALLDAKVTTLTNNIQTQSDDIKRLILSPGPPPAVQQFQPVRHAPTQPGRQR